MKRTVAYFIYIAVVLAAVFAQAHGDVHQRIAMMKQEMEHGNPTADQFLQRAELWRLDGDFLAALADCTEAAKIDSANSFVCLERAKVFVDQKKFNKAKSELDRFLEKHPDHAEALLLRGRVLVIMNELTVAQADYRSAIRLAASPQPDGYFEFATALKNAGRLKEAIAVLDEGIQKCGAASLMTLAVEFDVKAGNIDAALARLEKLASQSQRKDTWWFRRGEILENAGRTKEAAESFDRALIAIATLPKHLQSSENSKQLKTEITAALLRTKNIHE